MLAVFPDISDYVLIAVLSQKIETAAKSLQKFNKQGLSLSGQIPDENSL